MTKSKQGRIGDQGEQHAMNILNGLGVEFLRPIPTKIGLEHAGARHGRRLFFVHYKAKAAGDIRGVLPGGQSVLVEVKTRTTSSRLVWSDFEEHQPATLAEHKEHGGLSLVVWICELGIFVMEWPIAGLDGPGMGIGKDEAIAAEWKGAK